MKVADVIGDLIGGQMVKRIFVMIALLAALALSAQSAFTVVPEGTHGHIPECNDGIDNDNDDLVDWDGVNNEGVVVSDPDPGCVNEHDNREADPPFPPFCPRRSCL